MNNTLENILREKLIKKYHEYGFAKFTGEELSSLYCEVNILEELAEEVCNEQGIATREFILGVEDTK